MEQLNKDKNIFMSAFEIKDVEIKSESNGTGEVSKEDIDLAKEEAQRLQEKQNTLIDQHSELKRMLANVSNIIPDRTLLIDRSWNYNSPEEVLDKAFREFKAKNDLAIKNKYLDQNTSETTSLKHNAYELLEKIGKYISKLGAKEFKYSNGDLWLYERTNLGITDAIKMMLEKWFSVAQSRKIIDPRVNMNLILQKLFKEMNKNAKGTTKSELLWNAIRDNLWELIKESKSHRMTSNIFDFILLLQDWTDWIRDVDCDIRNAGKAYENYNFALQSCRATIRNFIKKEVDTSSDYEKIEAVAVQMFKPEKAKLKQQLELPDIEKIKFDLTTDYYRIDRMFASWLADQQLPRNRARLYLIGKYYKAYFEPTADSMSDEEFIKTLGEMSFIFDEERWDGFMDYFTVDHVENYGNTSMEKVRKVSERFFDRVVLYFDVINDKNVKYLATTSDFVCYANQIDALMGSTERELNIVNSQLFDKKMFILKNERVAK